MNKIAWIFLLVFLAQGTKAQKLSEEATISVITCGPFQEAVYFAFGHSAFRVHDQASGIDYAFNYGVFDFEQPNFLLNFARGHNFYMLGVHEYPRFLNSYVADNRYIHEQVLNLTGEQRQAIFDYLMWNSLPENRSYRYDYFYDNCATKIRDVVMKVLGDRVTFNGDYISTHYTIRQLTDIYLQEQPWGDLGIDICLGLPMDKHASPYEYMFLPDYIESGFDHATINNDSTASPLILEKKVIYSSVPEGRQTHFPHPLYVFGFLLLIAIAISIRDFRRKKPTTWFDIILFGVTGIVGLLLVMLWFFTDHKAAANNYNILWALPTHIVAVIAFVRKPYWLKNYFLGVAAIQGLLLITWTFLPQQLNTSLIPLVLTLLLRAFMQHFLWKVADSR